jgi:dCMP deaminase
MLMKQKFIDLYMDMAVRISDMSVANRLKVGCVVVKNDNIISFSWNGTLPGWDNACEDEHGVTKSDVLHSEENAVAKMAKDGISAKNAALFCTHSPCSKCARLIIAAGITEVYYKDEYTPTEGLDFLIKGGVKVTKI